MIRITLTSVLFMQFILFWGCRNDNTSHLVQVDHDAWNDQSFEFFANECHVQDSQLYIIGGKGLILRYHNDTFHTVQEYFNYCFDIRRQLVAYMSDSVMIRKNVRIYENYTTYKDVKYLIQIDGGESISFRVQNGELKLLTKEHFNATDPIFEPIDSLWCSNHFTSVPKTMMIWSVYIPDGSIQIYKASLYD